MTFKCIASNSTVTYVDVYLHDKCLILHLMYKNKNTLNYLFEFKDGQKLLNELKLYVSTKDVLRCHSFLKNNSSKVKFQDIKNEPNQLKLF